VGAVLQINRAELAVVAKIKELKLSGTPAEKIVKRPGHELWRNPGNAAQVAEQLCRNVHWFGRNNGWIWDPGSGGNSTGEALARGQVMKTNCGGFNLTARWIGHNVLNLDRQQFKGSYTEANDCFITLAGTQGIDPNWSGNVRTLLQDFDQLQAFFFKGHSFSRYADHMLDASTNVMNFHRKTDLFWCTLELVFSEDAGGRAFLVTNRHQPTVIPGPSMYACVSAKCLKKFRHLFPIVWDEPGSQGVTQSFIRKIPDTTGPGAWESMLLVSISHLPREFCHVVKLDYRM